MSFNGESKPQFWNVLYKVDKLLAGPMDAHSTIVSASYCIINHRQKSPCLISNSPSQRLSRTSSSWLTMNKTT
ncbi:hypothetical protein WN55_05156 [Dufourea novaeangliae]|uniref:Uncharacterized protein n=1 Tax=Dufourea novaeangliae TaxID=178035 RepID=A0A154PQF3_DUFNO|nr:hypothetical protein WN55_05156 [Dufourea novaeangliae]